MFGWDLYFILFLFGLTLLVLVTTLTVSSSSDFRYPADPNFFWRKIFQIWTEVRFLGRPGTFRMNRDERPGCPDRKTLCLSRIRPRSGFAYHYPVSL